MPDSIVEGYQKHGQEAELALQLVIGAPLLALLSQVTSVFSDSGPAPQRLRFAILVALAGWGVSLMVSITSTIMRCFEIQSRSRPYLWGFAMVVAYCIC
jgi:hypothetical protein